MPRLPQGTTYVRGNVRRPNGTTWLQFNADRNGGLDAALSRIGDVDVEVVSADELVIDGTPHTIARGPEERIAAALPPEGVLPTVAQLRTRAARLATWLRQPAAHTAEECGDELLRIIRLAHRFLEGRDDE